MSLPKLLVLSVLALPLAAQAWDVRLEVPFPQGQNLPQTLLSGTGDLLSQKGLDTGHGLIVTANHRIVRVGPVLKFEWGLEYSQLQTSGSYQVGANTAGGTLKQTGLGIGVNAQFWLPFTGLAAEFGAIERVHAYHFDLDGASQNKDIARPWLRVGLRWNLPLPGINPYVAASYQQPMTKDHPTTLSSATDLSTYLGAQGTGQEFQRMWTFGVGLMF